MSRFDWICGPVSAPRKRGGHAPLRDFTAVALANAGHLVAILLVAALLAGCTKPVSQKAQDKKAAIQAGLQGGKLVFSDDFERKELGRRWNAAGPQWTIRNGQLTVSNAKNEGCWLTEKLPEHTRVEFDARSDSDDGDIKFEIFATQPTHQAGYVAVLGGWKNSLSIIARLDEHGSDRLETREHLVTAGKTYRMAAVRLEGGFDWYVDGKLVLSYNDESPIEGRYFGFNNWATAVRFDNLAVYDLSEMAATNQQE